MRRLLILLLGAVLSTQAQSQHLSPEDYVYPILGVEGLYAANFGEIRTGHFHAGVDIKTEGVVGKQLVAAADGYIARVVISPGGYGRAVYLVTNKGTTAVYGHLSRFRDDIETYVRNECYARKANSIDLSFPPQVWPVKQGECVGWSGNSGTSAGPHLHYELRQTTTGHRLNTVREGIIRPQDNIAPRIVSIHYIQVDTLDGVCLRSPLRSYATEQIAPGRYRLAQRQPIGVGRRGYFIAQVTDRRNGVDNTFGIWRLSASVDGKPYFEYRMDGFLPENSGDSDAVTSYALQKGSRNEVIRLARIDQGPETFYTLATERGVIRTSQRQVRRICIEAEDDCGNRSSLEFDIRGLTESFQASADTLATVVRPESAAVVGIGKELRATIPAGALYEAIRCRPQRVKTPQALKADSGLVVLSAAFSIFGEKVPLRRSIGIEIQTQVPLHLQLYATLALITPKGVVFAAGTYADGSVSGKTRSSEPLIVVADTLSPQITPLFTPKADLRQATSLRFRVKDNFSGISTWSLFIDGEWAASEQFPMQNTIVHIFDKSAPGRTHTVELRATDACGNTAFWSGIFCR